MAYRAIDDERCAAIIVNTATRFHYMVSSNGAVVHV